MDLHVKAFLLFLARQFKYYNLLFALFLVTDILKKRM